MAKLPTNMIRRKDREGYWFRGIIGGRLRQVSLGIDYRPAVQRLRSLKTDGPPTEGLSVDDAASRWLKVDVPTRRNDQGQRDTRARVTRYLTPFLGDCILDRMAPDRVQEYRLWLEQHDLSPQSVAHCLSDLRRMLNWCVETGYIVRSPFPRRALPRIQERAPDRLTDDEVAQLTALPEPYGFTCRLLLGSGVRWGEACRALASDVDRQGFLVVQHRTKSGKVRRVPLPPELLSELRTRVGKLVPFSVTSRGSFAKVIRNATGLARFHPHLTRHTYACSFIERGGNLAVLQAILGHSSVLVTQRYARLSDEAVQREAERVHRHPTVTREDQEGGPVSTPDRWEATR